MACEESPASLRWEGLFVTVCSIVVVLNATALVTADSLQWARDSLRPLSLMTR